MTTVYIPEFETQRDENAPTPWTNCNPASCAMLVKQWTWGAIDTSDVELRRADPNGISPASGMNFIAVSMCIEELFPQLGRMQFSEHTGGGTSQMTWAQLRDHLANGGGAACGGYYSSLFGHVNDRGQAVNRWQPNGTFGHMMFFCDYRESDLSVLLMDPLGHGDYAGDRVELWCLWNYIWKAGNNENAIVTAAHGFANPRPAEPAPPRPASREERLAREVIHLRAQFPAQARHWAGSAMTQADDGLPLRRESRLAGEVLYLRRVATGTDNPTTPTP